MHDDSPFQPPARRQHGSMATPRQPHAVELRHQTPAADNWMHPLVQMAQGIERDEADMLDRAEHVGRLLGQRAYYSFPVGGKRVEGLSIVGAEALASEWGCIVHEVIIVSAQPMSSGGQRVHLRARVVDLKRLNVGSVDNVISTAPPSGAFARKLDQTERWHAMQIQSAASKVKRNALLDVMPGWFVDTAMEAAMSEDRLHLLNGKSVGQKAVEIVGFAEQRYGLTAEEIAAYIGRDIRLWTVAEIAAMRDLFIELKDGSATVETVREAGKPEKVSPDQSAPATPAALRTEPAGLPEPVDIPQMNPTETREKVATAPAQQQDDGPPPHGEPTSQAPPPAAAPHFTDVDEARAYVLEADARVGSSIAVAVRQDAGVSVTTKPDDGRLSAPKVLAWANALHAAEQSLMAEAGGE